jgi:hypothetical protein
MPVECPAPDRASVFSASKELRTGLIFSRRGSKTGSMPLQNQDKRRLISQDVPVKRFRVSRACDQCRAAREKCDGTQPTCSPCVDNKRACAYTSNPKKRGLQPGYIRGLETTLAFIFQQNPEVEATVYNQLIQENTALLARSTKESNQLYKNWTKSRVCRDLNKALAGEQIGTGEDRQPSPNEDSDIDTEDANFGQTTPGAQSHQSVRRQEKTVRVYADMCRFLRPVIQAMHQHIQPGHPCRTLSLQVFNSLYLLLHSYHCLPIPGNYWKLTVHTRNAGCR